MSKYTPLPEEIEIIYKEAFEFSKEFALIQMIKSEEKSINGTTWIEEKWLISIAILLPKLIKNIDKPFTISCVIRNIEWISETTDDFGVVTKRSVEEMMRTSTLEYALTLLDAHIRKAILDGKYIMKDGVEIILDKSKYNEIKGLSGKDLLFYNSVTETVDKK